MASAWAALSRYDPERPLEIWLKRIALNKCRDRGRKDTVRRRVFSLIGVAPEALEQAPDRSALPDQVRLSLALAQEHRFGSGVIYLCYRPA